MYFIVTLTHSLNSEFTAAWSAFSKKKKTAVYKNTEKINWYIRLTHIMCTYMNDIFHRKTALKSQVCI